MSRRSSTLCRRPPCCSPWRAPAARAPRPSVAAAGRHPRRRRRRWRRGRPWRMVSSGAAAPTTWRSAPSSRRRSATRAGRRPRGGGSADVTGAPPPTSTTTTPDARCVVSEQSILHPLAYSGSYRQCRLSGRLPSPQGRGCKTDRSCKVVYHV